MNPVIPLGPHYDYFIRSQVEAGHFPDAEAVIIEGLRLMEHRELQRLQLRQRIQNALADERRYSFDEVIASLEDEDSE